MVLGKPGFHLDRGLSTFVDSTVFICVCIYICIAPFLPSLGTAGSRWQEVPQLLVRVAQKKLKTYPSKMVSGTFLEGDAVWIYMGVEPKIG